MTSATAGHHEGVRAEALACFLGLASFACGGGDIASAEGGAPPAGAAALEGGAPPAGGTPPDGDVSPGGGLSADGGPSSAPSSPAADAGCVPLQTEASPLALGATCISYQEEEVSFAAFTEGEVSFESNSPQCGTNRVCLYNHFRGRVTCPYGQDGAAHGPGGTPGCLTAGTCEPVRPTLGQPIPAQCAGRSAAEAVYCSCRCANIDGGTGDGTYCACPSGMTCTQVVSYAGPPSPGQADVSGAYCVKTGTQWDGGGCAVSCDPTSAPCP